MGGTLFTERLWVKSENNEKSINNEEQTDDVELVLHWSLKVEPDLPDSILGLFLWAISDLHNGLLAIGGETAVGRGSFEKNGEAVFDGSVIDNPGKYYRAAMKWCREQRNGVNGVDNK